MSIQLDLHTGVQGTSLLSNSGPILLVDRRTGENKVFSNVTDLEYQYPAPKLESMLSNCEADLFLIGPRLALNYTLVINPVQVSQHHPI